MSSNQTIDLTGLMGLDDVVAGWAQETCEENRKVLNANVKRAAQTARKVTSAESPRRYGGYAKGWRVKTTMDGDIAESVVYNGRYPGLTHLLERGHALVLFGLYTGRFVRAFPHIDPGYEAGKAELLP